MSNFTVLIPVFNRTRFLRRAIQCVVSQGQWPIVVNDGTDDSKTPDSVREIVHGDCICDRVKAIHRRENMGWAASMNDAIRSLPEAEWIHILNDDDMVYPGFYDVFRQVPPIASIAACHFQNQYSQDPDLYEQKKPLSHKETLCNLTNVFEVGNPFNVCNVVFKRSLWQKLGGFREDLKYTPDWDFFRRACAETPWWYTPAVLSCRSEREDNYSHILERSGAARAELEAQGLALPEATIVYELSAAGKPGARHHADVLIADAALIRAGKMTLEEARENHSREFEAGTDNCIHCLGAMRVLEEAKA